MTIAPPKAPASPSSAWPAEVELILSAMDAAGPASRDRRLLARLPYRVRAELELYSADPDDPPIVLYTRDVDPRGIGFITATRLPLGYGGQVRVFAPDGTKPVIACTVTRCREAAPGWFEGAIYFNRSQPRFEL
ncbi:MAG TPA: hypothetical protein PKB10_10920 [Tepidisphaeraceae bacterium]|nr:hypothetical protein [Tepidisphaeraceae bacterium]